MGGNGLNQGSRAPHGADTWLVIRKAFHWLERHGLDSIVETGLGHGDFAVLKLLLFSGPLPVNVIGAKVLLTSGSISTAIDRLEGRGLVKRGRHPTDGRTFLVNLTARGRETITPASKEHARRMDRLMSILTLQEQRELARLMKRLGKHAMASYANSDKGQRAAPARQISAP
jgi:MarR family 2-MHQ and catechol resistance regulon transcriptional repressor